MYVKSLYHIGLIDSLFLIRLKENYKTKNFRSLLQLTSWRSVGVPFIQPKVPPLHSIRTGVMLKLMYGLRDSFPEYSSIYEKTGQKCSRHLVMPISNGSFLIRRAVS
jgi:hypothetical protein